MSEDAEIAQNLDELSRFVEYFRSKELTEKLVDWVSEELGVRKFIARLIIQKLAPWILERANEAAKSLGESTFSVLHEKFAKKFSVYRLLTTDILSVLKAHVEKDSAERELLKNRRAKVQESLRDPSFAKDLLNDGDTFRGLDSDQQAYVSLMVAYAAVDQKLEVINRLLSPSLRLDRKEAREVRPFSVGWLEYRQRKSEFFGRGKELAELQDFFHDTGWFRWWVITGEGGVGKSRLALESMRELSPEWEWGFIDSKTLKSFNWDTWQIEQPTVIVVDYASSNPEAVAEMLSVLQRRYNDIVFNVRVLLIERVAGERTWFDEIAGLGNSKKRDRAISLFREKPLHLGGLTINDQRLTLISYLVMAGMSGYEIPDDLGFWDNLQALSGNGRPIFIGMVAAALASGGADKIRQWDRKQLLSFVYAHEKEVWKGLVSDSKLRKSALDLVLIATAVGGVSPRNSEELQQICAKITSVGLDPWALSAPAKLLSGRDDWSLQPDIFGEFALSVEWNTSCIDTASITIKNYLLCSLQLSSVGTISTIVRAASDFPCEDFPFNWLNVMAGVNDNAELVSNIYYRIIITLGEQLHFEAFDNAFNRYQVFCGRFSENINVLRRLADACSYVSHVNYIEERWEKHDVAFDRLSQILSGNLGDKQINIIYAKAAYNAMHRYDYQDLFEKHIAVFDILSDVANRFNTEKEIIQHYLMAIFFTKTYYERIQDWDKYDQLFNDAVEVAITNEYFENLADCLYGGYFVYARRKKFENVHKILTMARGICGSVKSESTKKNLDLIFTSDMENPPKLPSGFRVKLAPRSKQYAPANSPAPICKGGEDAN